MANIKDIAKLAGVSISTVSIIINGKSEERKITIETQNKVKEAMKKLNYQPNLSAKKLRTTDTKKTIALFWTTDFRDVMLAQFLKGLQNQIKQQQLDYNIVIYPYENDHLCLETSLTKVSQFHGAIIANASKKDLVFLENLNPMMPIVLYNRHLPNYSCVYVDDKDIANKAFEMLNHNKKVAIVSANTTFEGMNVRDNHLIQQLGSQFHCKYMANHNSPKGGFEIAPTIDFKSIDAIFASSDLLALGLMHYCFLHQIEIPKDIEIVAIGNGLTSMSEYLNPSLSVIQIPLEKMAEECIMVLSHIFDSSTLIKRKIDPLVIDRNSQKK